MRQLKFRAWYFCPVRQEHIMRPITNENARFITDDEYYPDRIIMQYTGLKDKNGVDIYEGDVVQCSYGVCKVEYNENIGAFMVYWIDDAEANIEFLGLERKMRWCREGAEAFEVIGNIYSNPELL